MLVSMNPDTNNDTPMTDSSAITSSPPSEAELREWAREHHLATGDQAESDVFPRLGNISAAFFYRFVVVPDDPPETPEYTFVRTASDAGLTGEDRTRYDLFIAMWNTLWEAGPERRGMLYDEHPEELAWVFETETDLRLVPRTSRHRYHAYLPLYHLLPADTLRRFGLPLIKRGIWPHRQRFHLLDRILPKDFDARLRRAFSYHIWPFLGARGRPSAFSPSEPIRLLSHNLDFWLPYADMAAQERARAYGRVPFDDDQQRADFEEYHDKAPPGVSLERPYYGAQLWMGEGETREVTHRMVELADAHGELRGILDAVRSHRVEDDFTDVWSFEREDFERKLYNKRSDVSVRFVELDDTVPVHGPESEIHEGLLWEDFFALLNHKEREIVVCLRNGVTNLGEIADRMGYANHSPISKRLKRIREKAARLLDIDPPEGGRS